MRAAGGLTRKGERTSRQILDAAVRVAARDGLAASSMQRIADEAGVAKRAVIYYFETREGLLEAVVRHVGGRMLDELEVAVGGTIDPAEIVDRGFEVVWEAVTNDRALLAVWFGLHAEAVTNTDTDLRRAASYISSRLEEIVSGLIDVQFEHGRSVRVDREALVVLTVANVQGLASYYLDHGDTPALRAAIAAFQEFLRSVVRPITSGGGRAAT